MPTLHDDVCNDEPPIDNDPHVIPEQFSALSKGSKFTCGEAALEKLITKIVEPYGITHLVKPDSARKNKDDDTKELFPHRRFY